jgi:peptidyl-prolyl cis-trans isomerase B (cyclophilin B)
MEQVKACKRDWHGGQHVTPKGRERAYEKRRYEEWQARLAAKQARNRRIRRIALITAAAVATVAVIGGGFLLLTRGNDSDSTASPAATPSPAATSSATPSASAGAATPAAGGCPAVTVKPPAKPKQFSAVPPASDAGGKNWKLSLNTTCGAVTVELDGKKAPQAVSAMLKLARSGYFDNTPCHRLTTAGIYVLQCGDPTGTGSGGPGFQYGPVENAPKDNVYKAATVAMARQGDNGKSMGSQFFLVYKNSTIPSDSAGGYTVLGDITKGLDVVNKVAAGGVTGGSGDGAPARAVSITSTSVSAG